jgi:Methyltransferase domain
MTSIKIWARQVLDDINLFLRKILRRLVRKVVEIVFTDLDMLRYFNDPFGSVAFEAKYLIDVPAYRDRPKLYDALLRQIAGNDELFLEFGVYKGDSINRLAAIKPAATFHGFDSFVGLPEHWSAGARKGAFDVQGRLPAVRRNVRLIAGFYEDTLAAFVAEQKGKTIAFMHIDCDIYSSTRTVLRETKPLLRPGTIILFDEYFNAPGWQDCEYKAFMEFVAETNTRFEYVGYVRHGAQVAVRLL